MSEEEKNCADNLNESFEKVIEFVSKYETNDEETLFHLAEVFVKKEDINIFDEMMILGLIMFQALNKSETNEESLHYFKHLMQCVEVFGKSFESKSDLSIKNLMECLK